MSDTHKVASMSEVNFNADLRKRYKRGVVDTNIYFDDKQARFRVKVGATWVGSYYSLEGARAALANAKRDAISKAATARKVRSLKNKLTAIVEKERKTRIQIEKNEAKLKAHNLEYNDTIREIGFLEEQARRGAT